MKRIAWIVAAACVAFACTARAEPQDCTARLTAIGHSPTGLHLGDVIRLDGQNIKYEGGPAQQVCDLADQANAPLTKANAEIQRLKQELRNTIVARDGLKQLVNDTNWFKQHYRLGWAAALALGVSLYTLIIYMLGRGSRRNGGHNSSVFLQSK